MRASSLAIFFLIVFLFSSSNSYSEEQIRTFRLGIIQSLTGHAAEDGENVLRAIKLATEEINKEKPGAIELIVEDDRTEPVDTVSAYQKMKTAKVDAIFGATWVHTSLSIGPLAERDKITLFNASCFLETLEIKPKERYRFGNMYSIKADVKTFERYLKMHGFKKIAILRNSSSWSTTQVVEYRRIADKLGVEVVEEHEAINIENNDWRAVLPRIKKKGAEAVVVFLGKTDTDLVLRRAMEMNLGLRFFGALHSLDGFRQSEAKEAFEGFCFTYPYEQLARNADFNNSFKQRFGEEPRVYADHAYDALKILFKAYEQSQKSNKSISEELRNVKHTGLVGDYKFSPEMSFSIGESSLVCIESGQPNLK